MAREKISILFPGQDRVEYRFIPEETWHDLGFDSITEKVAKKNGEAALIQRVMTGLTDDPEVSRFRAGVFDDILRNPAIRDRLVKLLDQVKMFYDYGVVNRHAGDEAGIWDLMHRLEEYHDYIVTVEAIRECLSDSSLKSEGLIRLRNTVDEIYRDHAFEALKRDVEEMRTAASAVKSVTVGINLNERFEAVSLGLIGVNAKPFSRSGILKNFVSAINPRDDIHPEAEWDGKTSVYPSNPIGEEVVGGMDRMIRAGTIMRNPLLGLSMATVPSDDGSARITRNMDAAASMLLSRLVRRLKEMLGRYLNVSVKEIADLIPEMTFYVRWAEYIEKLKKEGWIFSMAEAVPAGDGVMPMTAEGFYNLKLTGTEKPENVIRNDLSFDAEKKVYILTGANRGGKTTVTQAAGQLFLMAQSGLSVPAERFVFAPADQVLTHFPADEDKTMDLGRLGEECQRFKALYQQAGASSLLLLNETFSTTSFEEGYYIAADAVRAILRRGIRTIYNTHMHKLAYELDGINREGRAKAWSLVSETRDGKHSFRIRIAPPEGKSFARDIAEKYGVTYEDLTADQ